MNKKRFFNPPNICCSIYSKKREHKSKAINLKNNKNKNF